MSIVVVVVEVSVRYDFFSKRYVTLRRVHLTKNRFEWNLLFRQVAGSNDAEVTEDDKMAWKSDSHGFYQSTNNNGFLNRFASPEDEELDNNVEKLENIFYPDFKFDDEQLSGGRFSYVETRDNSELFNDEDEVKDVNDHILKRRVPLVFIQAPTPSDISRASSSIGSSRPETPDSNYSEAAASKQPPLKSNAMEAELPKIQDEVRIEDMKDEDIKDSYENKGDEVFLSNSDGDRNTASIVSGESAVPYFEEGKTNKKFFEKQIDVDDVTERNLKAADISDNNNKLEKGNDLSLRKEEENDISEEKFQREDVEEREGYARSNLESQTKVVENELRSNVFQFDTKAEMPSVSYNDDLDSLGKRNEHDRGKRNALNGEQVAAVEDDSLTKTPLSSRESSISNAYVEVEAYSQAKFDTSTQAVEEVDDVNFYYVETPIGGDIRNDSSSSVEQLNNSLLTSWTEQQIKNEISQTDVADTIQLEHRTDSSPSITWRMTTNNGQAGVFKEDEEDFVDDILQTSIGSATDLREILERSLRKEEAEVGDQDAEEQDAEDDVIVKNDELRKNEIHDLGILPGGSMEGYENGDGGSLLCDDDDVEAVGIKTVKRDAPVHRFMDEMSDGASGSGTAPWPKDGKLSSNDGPTGNGMLNNEDQNEDGYLFDKKESDIKLGAKNVNHRADLDRWFDSRINRDLRSLKRKERQGIVCYKTEDAPDELMDVLENLEAFSLLRFAELEKVKSDVIQDIRSKMEESCNGIPIDKISTFVYDQWQELLQALVEDENASFVEVEAAHDNVLKDMRSKLDKARKENFDLSKTAAEGNSCKVENGLLRKQIGGLEEFVSSLERRIEGRAKENSKLMEEIDQLRRVAAERENELKDMVKAHEGVLKSVRIEINSLKEDKMRLENEIKMKDIENRRILNEKEKARDEVQNDFEKVNANTTVLRNRLTELQSENETLRTANEADQTIINHLEKKLQSSDDVLKGARNEKSALLAELQESKVREADLRKRQDAIERENGQISKEKEAVFGKLRLVQEEKKSIELQLNEKLSTDMKNAEAMLKEIKSLESSLNSVRSEKSLIEDKYNNLKFELERVEIIKNRKKQNSDLTVSGRKQKNKAGDDALIDFDSIIDDRIQHSVDSRRLFEAQYSALSQSSVNTNRSLDSRQTFDTNRTTLDTNHSHTDGNHLTDSRLSSERGISPLALRSPTSASSSATIGSLDSGSTLESHHSSTRPHIEKRLSLDVNYSEASQRSLGRQFSLDVNRTSHSGTDAKSRTDSRGLDMPQDSDAESVGSYADFPRDSSALPSVLVVRTNVTPSRSSETGSSTNRSARPTGNRKLAERKHSRPAEKEESGVARSVESRQDSTATRQFSGDVRHQTSEENVTQNSYSAEDTR